MCNLYNNRVYGVQIIKSKNSNYNADFTGSPRTLPDGTVYATDKVAKFNIRRYLGKNEPNDIFVKETIHKQQKNKKITIGPRTLIETYQMFFCNGEQESINNQTKEDVLRNLLTKLDIRLFGVTFAPSGDDAKGKNISIHGPVQISYGINRLEQLKDSGMYTDQIGSPYANESGASQSTLGAQTRSQEAHYVHHFSINPKNLSTYVKQFEQEEKEQDNQSNKFQLLSCEDIQKLKQAMALATTYYDSTSKKDSENELLLWIELKENSEKILKNFSNLIEITPSEKGKTKIDFTNATEYLKQLNNDIEKIELYYDEAFTEVTGLSEFCKNDETKEKCIIHKALNDILLENDKDTSKTQSK